MNEDLYRDMCLILSTVTHISAKRLLEGDVSSFEIASLEEAYNSIEKLPVGAPVAFIQSSRLAVDETRYFAEGKDFPFQEFSGELDRRLKHLIFIDSTFKELSQEISLRLGINVYQLMQGHITESQKIEIRLLLSQLNDYEKEDIEKFMDELKKRKDLQ